MRPHIPQRTTVHTPNRKPPEDPMNLRQAHISSGWVALDTRTSPRAYRDCSGKRFGTLEKGGVRLALSIGSELGEERGSVMLYDSGEPTDVILQAIVVDTDSRNKGAARATLSELVALAESTHSTLYVEPTPIEDKPVPVDGLRRLYGEFGFSQHAGCQVVMSRRAMITA